MFFEVGKGITIGIHSTGLREISGTKESGFPCIAHPVPIRVGPIRGVYWRCLSKKLLKVGRKIAIEITGSALRGDVAEIGDLPRILEAISIRVRP